MLRAKNQVLLLYIYFDWQNDSSKLLFLKLITSYGIQALLQMQDVPSAVNALQFYSNVQPSIRYLLRQNLYFQLESCMWSFSCCYVCYIFLFSLIGGSFCLSDRGRNVYVQFSSHQELTTMDQNSQGRGDEVSDFLFYKRWPCASLMLNSLLMVSDILTNIQLAPL